MSHTTPVFACLGSHNLLSPWLFAHNTKLIIIFVGKENCTHVMYEVRSSHDFNTYQCSKPWTCTSAATHTPVQLAMDTHTQTHRHTHTHTHTHTPVKLAMDTYTPVQLAMDTHTHTHAHAHTHTHTDTHKPVQLAMDTHSPVPVPPMFENTTSAMRTGLGSRLST